LDFRKRKKTLNGKRRVVQFNLSNTKKEKIESSPKKKVPHRFRVRDKSAIREGGKKKVWIIDVH